ncbi:ustiloxin B cluster transcription factor ustR [Lasiodiplodia theobromae]|uniref:Ustiloxin B cluster transcription factor ustR n=1 Tax=Lasiodiplodia theobromae TaxID=45133 RepID=A0A5N5D2H0_9PEZI|nr:ustiloxin B cluster transcription factor ustR [Lasiodiplodia theobromae]
MYHWTTADIETTLSHESQFAFHGYAVEGLSVVGEPLHGSLTEEPGSLGLPDSSLERETSLLMLYLDHGFRLQFPAYEPPLSAGGRTWLLSLLTSTKPTYYATLSLAARYSKLLLPQDEVSGVHELWREEEMKHRPIAMEELQACVLSLTTSGSPHNIRATVNALACMMQMLSLDSLETGVEYWTSSLDMAAPLLITLAEFVEAQPASSDTASWTAVPVPPSSSDQPLSYESSAALKFVTTAFIWIDALSRISTGTTPIFHSHRHLLSTHASIIQLDQLTGCANWVLSHILAIAALDRWKKDQQRSHRLSLRELAARAAAIETQLMSTAAASLGSTESLATRIAAFDPRRRAARVFCTTHVFALAALSYLHVVVSGFNPALDEVRGNVEETVAALEALPDARLLRYLAWPFCVTGCLAEPRQEDGFRRMLARAEAAGGGGSSSDGDEGGDPALLRCRTALEVMEEVWRRRRNGLPLPSSWADAMQLHGAPVLLI